MADAHVAVENGSCLAPCTPIIKKNGSAENFWLNYDYDYREKFSQLTAKEWVREHLVKIASKEAVQYRQRALDLDQEIIQLQD